MIRHSLPGDLLEQFVQLLSLSQIAGLENSGNRQTNRGHKEHGLSGFGEAGIQFANMSVHAFEVWFVSHAQLVGTESIVVHLAPPKRTVQIIFVVRQLEHQLAAPVSLRGSIMDELKSLFSKRRADDDDDDDDD